jgi:16S rRNA processing protein RimM
MSGNETRKPSQTVKPNQPAKRDYPIEVGLAQPEGWSLVGKVREAHGLKGEVFIVTFAKSADWAEELTKIGFETKTEKSSPGDSKALLSQFKEYKVKRRKAHKVGLIAQLEGVDDRGGAEALKGALVSIPSEHLTSKKGERIFLSEVLGFEVRDAVSGKSGKVVGFSSNTAQDLLEVEIGKSVHLVPLVPQFLVRILWDEKQIEMRLPEGLLE